MQMNRLFETVYILLDRKNITARELAEHFEVSTRTIYRDIERLSSAGIPVYMTKGKGGGVSLLPEFVLNKAILTEKDKNNIISSLQAISAVNYTETDAVLNKLSSLFGELQADWIEIDFSTWVNSENEKMLFDQLKTAILAKRTIRFTYSNARSEKTTRQAEPLKLCYKGNSWYLYGYCKIKNDIRFFKLRRMKELVVLEEVFTRTAPKHIFEESKIFLDEDYMTLKLEISSTMAYRVYDEFETFETLEDGNFIAELKVPKDDWLLSYITSFGENCEVLEPIEIREMLKEKLQNISKLYK